MNRKSIFILSIVLMAIISVNIKAKAQALPSNYSIHFWWDNFGNTSRGNGIFTSGQSINPLSHDPQYHFDLNSTINLKNYIRDDFNDLNDHARSATVSGSAGIRFIVYDKPSGQTDDDWTEIYLKTAVTDYYIPSLETAVDDPNVRIIYHRRNGLDGKVSALRIQNY